MKGKVCGLCGNFNGNSTDEYTTIQGKRLDNYADFGNSWIDPTEERTIENVKLETSAPCSKLTPDQVKRIKSYCSVLTNDKLLFSKCSKTVDPTYYGDLCISDMCSCEAEGLANCQIKRCDVFQQYSRMCSQKGIVLQWRNDNFCPAPKCENGKIYKECGLDCGQECGSQGYESECNSIQCVDGCFCPVGTLWDGDKCVKKEECSCRRKAEGKRYAVGDHYINDCEKCTCSSGGLWKCTPTSDCVGRCQISGDPHYKTFDGRYFSFSGQCEYVLVMPGRGVSLSTPFTVWVENTICKKTEDSICTKMVTIQIKKNGKEYLIRLKKASVELGGTKVAIPLNMDGVYVRHVSNIMTRLTSDVGLEVLWDGGSRVEVIVHSKYRNKLMGLCGNFNGKITDDSLTASGDDVKNVTQFANDWKTSAECQTSFSGVYESACTQSIQYSAFAKKTCSVLTEGKFKACNDVVDPRSYIKQCEHDICTCGSREKTTHDCECTAMASYSRACALKGVVLEWRNDNLCSN